MLLISLLISAIAVSILILKSQRFYIQELQVFKPTNMQNIETDDWSASKETNDSVENEHLFTENRNVTMRQNNNIISTHKVLLYNQLHKLLEDQKLYLDTELDIESTVKILHTNKKYLYYAITENCENNFRNIVNRYRIEEAKELISGRIKEGETFSISDIYMQTGFNSSVTFYRAFKLVTGFTPKEYSIELKKEIAAGVKAIEYMET